MLINNQTIVSRTTSWNVYGDFSRSARAVATPTALVSSVCIIAFTILSGYSIAMTIASISLLTVIGCSLSAIKALCQWHIPEQSPTFLKQILSRPFLYGAIAGVGSVVALIAITRFPIYYTEPFRFPCVTPEQAASGCCFEIELIKKRIKEGSIIVKDGLDV